MDTINKISSFLKEINNKYMVVISYKDRTWMSLLWIKGYPYRSDRY